MIFTKADPRYAGRLDDKQGSDTVVTMETVREANAFNAELTDESTWLWLTSEQMGFSLRLTGGEEHEERAEDLDLTCKRGSVGQSEELLPSINPQVVGSIPSKT